LILWYDFKDYIVSWRNSRTCWANYKIEPWNSYFLWQV
jgi:hypothetical protein